MRFWRAGLIPQLSLLTVADERPLEARDGQIFRAGIIQIVELRSLVIPVTIDTMTNNNTPIPEELETGREAPWEIDALWTPDIDAEDQAAWEIVKNRLELKTTKSLSYLAESILEAQWILCTPLEAIRYALDEHIEAMIETGHSLYRDELDNPIGHAEFVAALSEIVQFFVAHELQN